MSVKSISQQIIDEFIDELSKDKSIDKTILEVLKKILYSEDFKKEDIKKILKIEKILQPKK